MQTLTTPRRRERKYRDDLRTQKTRIKRKVFLFLWSVFFAYISLTSQITSAQEPEDISSTTDTATQGPNSAPSSIPTFEPFSSNQPEITVTEQNVENVATSTFSFSSSSSSSSSTPSNIFIPPQPPQQNCTPPAIDDFPTDLFTQAQRRQGYVAIHFLASLYIFYCLALVCDEYFVPSIECICEDLHLPSDVAGATFMAVATSSPELFTNVVGTFITEGDIGVGTIVGSAVFNILGVSACCGIAAKSALPLEWYPLTRDCIFYSISVGLLIFILGNRQVIWYEALILVGAYFIYIIVMYKNSTIRKWTENLVSNTVTLFGFHGNDDDEAGGSISGSRKDSMKSRRRASFVDTQLTSSMSEKTPLLASGHHSHDLESDLPSKDWLGEKDISAKVMDEMLIHSALQDLNEDEEKWTLIHVPCGQGTFTLLHWLISWPARFCFGFTVPDCRDLSLRNMWPVTFLMCIVWIAGLSYLVSWTMTVIGYTFSIPDSVMGLTFIAAGTSIPEAVSSVIVARQGLGTMSISNSIGSNTFDILICLGLPWLIKSSMMASNSDSPNFIQIYSGGLEYEAITLLVTLFTLYVILALNKFYLDRKVGVIALLLYACFLVFAGLFEMNVFFMVNLPTCQSQTL